MHTALPLRRYPFDNIANFRDLGGYAAEAAGATRWGVLFRSARLTDATPADLRALKALGVRTVLDLRMHAETRHRPDAGMDDPALGWRHIPVLREEDFDDRFLSAQQDTLPPMSLLYRHMLDNCQPGFRLLFDAIAEGLARGSVLFHCTAGKDRTGLTAMLLLSLCGVDRLDIIADYEVSRTYNLSFMPEDTTGSDPAHMMSTLDDLDERYGGPVDYLRAIGVPEGTLQTIRSALYSAR